jgi:hypothetical protein
MSYSIPAIGDKVTVIGSSHKEHTVLDVSMFDADGDPIALSSGGKLRVQVTDGLSVGKWVGLDSVYPVSEIERLTSPGGIPPASMDIEAIAQKMTRWMEGLPSQPDNSKLPEVVTLLMAIQYDKEKYYGSSWKGKGEIRGIMANLDRKYDRLDKMTNDEIAGLMQGLATLEELLVNGTIKAELVGESKIDAIADLTNYGILYMTYVQDNFPSLFKIWVDKNVPDYLKDKMLFLQQ